MKPESASPLAPFIRDFLIYVGRVSQFTAWDWLIYFAWIGMMMGLLVSVGGFVWLGSAAGVSFPAYVWNVPIGATIFVASIAIDTIGHRTIYKEELQKGESLIHGITIFCGITSVMALVAAYNNPVFFRLPALVLIVLSFFYSIIDEAMHWIRYLKQKSDRVEMWSHFGIFLGHGLMMVSWWYWFDQGYPGVAATLQALAGR